MAKSTRDKYAKTWHNFIEIQGVTAEKQPVEQDFLDWFERRKAEGIVYATLRTEHSHLNKVSVFLSSKLYFD